jgi:hypothetical protein
VTGSRPAAGIDRRIFVVGAPRSGTTLVQSLLAAHGATTSFTESHLFARHFRLLPGSSRPLLVREPAPRLAEFLAENDEPPTPAATRLAAAAWPRPLLPLRTRAVARRLLAVLDELTLRRGRSAWIEKTPRHLRYVPFLERLGGRGSGMRFVHVIREGLEVVASLHRASRDWERPYDIETCVRRWNADVGFSLDRAERVNDRFVFYEELTSSPQTVLERLLTGLGLDWQPAILERYAAVSERLITNHEEAWKADLGRGIRPSSTVQWRLSEEQRRAAAGSLRAGLYRQLRERVAGREGGKGGDRG